MGIENQFPYLNNTTADIRLTGMPGLLCPFPQNTSGSRQDMYASHLSQALVLAGVEFPLIFTGQEAEYGSYLFNSSEREQDAEILAVIPKYAPARGGQAAPPPHYLIIYKGLSDGLMHYCRVDRYFKGSDGFGFENQLRVHNLQAGSYLPRQTVLARSPAKMGEHRYGFGTNLNFCFMTLEETIEDAVLISETAARQMTTTEIITMSVPIRPGTLPLNLYGDEVEYKCFPDIGQQILPSGILMATRRIQADTFMADVDPSALREMLLADSPVFASGPGMTVADINVYPSRYNRIPQMLSQQLDVYIDGMARYWERIIEVYNQHKGKLRPSPAFSTLVTTAMGRHLAGGKSLPGISNNKRVMLAGRNERPIEFLQLEFTLVAERPVRNGFKLTGRDGAKGIICKIMPDADMPTDAHGFRADVVIDPTSAVKRMNTGQCNEAALNRISEFVRRQAADLAAGGDWQGAFQHILSWVGEINKNYAGLIAEVRSTPEARQTFVKEQVKSGIHLHTPPFLETIQGEEFLDNIVRWEKLFNVEHSPVTWTVRDLEWYERPPEERDPQGGNPRTFTSEVPVSIGKKYLLLLAKIPEVTSAGVARVNHIGVPIKPHHPDKKHHPVATTPVRLGEDENRLFLMDIDPDEVIRLNCLQANSLTALQAMVERVMLDPHPTQIGRIQVSNEELIRSSGPMAMFHHMMATHGIESRYTTTTKPLPTLTGGLSTEGLRQEREDEEEEADLDDDEDTEDEVADASDEGDEEE